MSSGPFQVERQPRIELQDSDLARRFVLEGLLQQSVQAVRPSAVPLILEWYLEAAVEGFPLPPIGVVADVGFLAFGQDTRSLEVPASELLPEPRVEHRLLPSPLLRQYEDLFLGKLYTDRSFERGGEGLCRYVQARDRAKALAFLLQQMGRRAGYRGVLFSPAVIRDLLRLPGEDVLSAARHSLSERGPLLWADQNHGGPESSLIALLYEDLIQHVRQVGEVLGAEDVFELERATAIAEFGQRLALRQVLRAAALLDAELPHQPVRPLKRRHEVTTPLVDEDTYPIGGFSSISNRGSIESLLHSQLAFMEPDANDRPDTFDVKFLRDELLYYARDENQFFRRRRTFVFALFSDLSTTRVKDPGLPWQRMIFWLALLMTAVRRLTDWLSEDALLFEFLFLPPDSPKRPTEQPLADERELLAMLFREQIANNTVRLDDLENAALLRSHCEQRASRSSCHCITLSTQDRLLELEAAFLTRMRFDQSTPAIAVDDNALETLEADQPLTTVWSATLLRLLESAMAG